jgi:hypothetical protein
MRLAPLVASGTVLLSCAALAQEEKPPPDCDAFFNGGAVPREGAGADVAVPPPGFGQPFIVSPPGNIANVPRNVEIVLAGDMSGFDVDPPQFSLEVASTDGNRSPLVRDGSRFHPLAPLPAGESFLVTLAPTAAHPCPDCVGTQQLGFTTGDEVDVTPPVLDAAPAVNVFVMPDPEQAAQCGVFFGTTHNIVVDFGPALPTNAFISVQARIENGPPVALFDQFNSGTFFQATGTVGPNVPVALDDAFYLAFTPRDLAGNVGGVRVVRVRARSFADQATPSAQLSPKWCEMPEHATVAVPSTLPTNGQLEVSFPFEEVPLALRVPGGAPSSDIPLVPVEDTPFGHVYATAAPLPAGADLDVVGLACPHCICEGCEEVPPTRVHVADVEDVEAPAAPVIVELGEDADPEPAVEEQCRPDRAALVVMLEAGEDDVAAPLDLRYDATLRLDGGPPLVLARGARPAERANGGVVLRLETGGLARILGRDFELTLTAVDAAGHRSSEATRTGQAEAAGGCAAAPAPAGALLAVLALLARRRVKTV